MKKFFSLKYMKYFLLIYTLLSIGAIVYFADHLLTKDMDNQPTTVLNDNWTITINNTTYENVSLDSFKFDALDKGDTVIMETTLPNNLNYKSSALTFYVRQTTVKMHADNVGFYYYGQDRVQLGKTVGAGLQIIDFPDDIGGKNLRIHLTVTEDNAFSGFDPIYISEWEASYKLVISENRLALFTSSFLVIFGIVASIVTIFAVMYSRKYTRILLLSSFSIFMGFWTLCFHDIHVIFPIPTYSVSLLEYMMLLLAPLPILGYLLNIVITLKNKPILRTFIFIYSVQAVLSTVTIILHTMDIVHAAAMLPYLQIMLIVHTLFFIFIFIKGRKNTKKQSIFYITGLLSILICFVYDIGIYAVNRYLGLQLEQVKGVSSLGIIIFLGILILDLAQDVSKSIIAKHEKEQLIKRAYTDDLTQINNRTFCSEYMEALDSKKNSRYTIINLDLNNLKITNDTLGHAQGDQLLISAAKVISETFSTSGIVGRMGGDEFIAIIPSIDSSKIDKLMNKFDTLMKEANVSIAHGVAYSSEFKNPTTELVYDLADDRMYENKKLQKKDSR